MSDYEARFEDTRVLFKTLHAYFNRFQERKSALQDLGSLSDLTARDHTVNEWLYDLERRVKALEAVLAASTGPEHEQPVEIAMHVDHLPK